MRHLDSKISFFFPQYINTFFCLYRPLPRQRSGVSQSDPVGCWNDIQEQGTTGVCLKLGRFISQWSKTSHRALHHPNTDENPSLDFQNVTDPCELLKMFVVIHVSSLPFFVVYITFLILKPVMLLLVRLCSVSEVITV